MDDREQKLLRLIELERAEGNVEGETAALRELKRHREGRTVFTDIADDVMSTDVPRAAGLTSRYALEAGGGLLDLATGPIKAGLNLAGMDYGPNTYADAASRLADAEGLASPETPGEEIVATGSRFMAGGGPFVKSGQALSKSPGLLGRIGENLMTSPGLQATSAGTAGLAGEAVRQKGGGPWSQFTASLLGGLSPAGMRGIVNAVRAGMPASAAAKELVSTLDLSDLSIASQRRVEGAVAEALKFGELDSAALQRLIDFERVGAQPTQASLTLDPVQKTQQTNLAKTGAQSSNPALQELAQVARRNNRALLGNLDDLAGDVDFDPLVGGQAAMGPVRSNFDTMTGRVDELYASARDTYGRSIPLNRAQFVERADQLLREQNLNLFLPEKVRAMVNEIAWGQKGSKGETIEVPFNVDTMQNLKTVLASEMRKADRAGDGNAKKASSLVYRALDEVGPIAIDPADVNAAKAMQAFDKARAAARDLKVWEESSPAIKAVVDGASPDQFMDKYILSKTASLDDVKKLVAEVRMDPDAFDALKYQVAAWIRDKAAPQVVDGEGTVNARSLSNALKKIGERKLALFFNKSELEQMKATNRVAFYEAYQPVGSAINNSNSGTMITGGVMNLINASPTARAAVDLGIRGGDYLFNPGRARAQLNPNLLQGGTRPPLKPALATPLAMPLVLPQEERQ